MQEEFKYAAAAAVLNMTQCLLNHLFGILLYLILNCRVLGSLLFLHVFYLSLSSIIASGFMLLGYHQYEYHFLYWT